MINFFRLLIFELPSFLWTTLSRNFYPRFRIFFVRTLKFCLNCFFFLVPSFIILELPSLESKPIAVVYYLFAFILNLSYTWELIYSTFLNKNWLRPNRNSLIPQFGIVLIAALVKSKSLFSATKEVGTNRFKPTLIFIYYILMLCVYANYYFLISSIFHDSELVNIENPFNVKLDIIDSFYFSTISSATIGYGDILPTSALTKLLVVTQVLYSLYFTISILSSVGLYIYSNKNDDEQKNQPPT